MGACVKDSNGIYDSEASCNAGCVLCSGCDGDSLGNCKDPKNNVCHYSDDTGYCPAGEESCGTVVTTKYSCANGACS